MIKVIFVVMEINLLTLKRSLSYIYIFFDNMLLIFILNLKVANTGPPDTGVITTREREESATEEAEATT